MRKLVFILLSSILIFSCRKEDEGVVDGPNLNDLYGPFTVITDVQPNQTTVNFTDGQEIFWNGELSKNTDWVVKLTGQSSGALRTITGNNRIISFSNSTWLGGANSFPGFALETVDVEITFPDEPNAPILSHEINITGLKLDNGYLITSFEEGILNQWEQFNQSTVTGTDACGGNESASGDCYYSVSGTVGWDWAIGSVMVKPESGSYDLPSNPNNLYFNMGFKALDHVGECFVLLWIDEDEDGDGVWEDGEDRIIYEYWSETDDWDLISLNYADLQYDIEGNVIDFGGNGLMEPSKVVGINLFFLSNPELGQTEAHFDHVIFTTDEPYRP